LELQFQSLSNLEHQRAVVSELVRLLGIALRSATVIDVQPSTEDSEPTATGSEIVHSTYAKAGDLQMASILEIQDRADISKDANSVPGFPQDAFMEGPVMTMDGMFDKPETHGLPPGWSGYMQGP
jgi:hypothetical protein